LAVAAAGPVDAWHLHDLPSLAAIAPLVPRSVPVVYDSHEIFLESGTAQRLPWPFRSLLGRYERSLVGRSTAVVTVNASLAEVLKRRYHPRRIVIVHNCPDRWFPPAQSIDRLRTATGIASSARIVIYLGGLGPDRGIEQLADALVEPGLEHAHLVLLGPTEQPERYAELASEARFGGRIHVLGPQPPGDLPEWVSSADIGTSLIQPTTLNHRLSTPNKLFECLAAGVPVLASDFPAMRRVVLDDPSGPLGAVTDPGDVTAVAGALRSLLSLPDDARAAMRARCISAAHDRWNWSLEAERLIALYAGLAKPAGPDPVASFTT
jgi:glycosyltransferase involved in cell wall biosynthesis